MLPHFLSGGVFPGKLIQRPSGVAGQVRPHKRVVSGDSPPAESEHPGAEINGQNS
ncbi:hypothetical protein DFO70_104262 [Cytobacillus firmus]|uniref:Uncharacterized protein n=2 Tax=Cytobacillus TaxID=2675230 RepID=A0A366K236_CYTFI|nr:hypothetical protein DFO70_104262 [Cytobacillus firmus]TDX43367.1 hypothetical protein DFO72_105264 [Cytobacillus oceanisediminis]